jgi:hypothetical protein
MEKLAIGMTVISLLFVVYLVLDNTWDHIKKSVNKKFAYTRRTVAAWVTKAFSQVKKPLLPLRHAYHAVLTFLYNTF